MSSPRPNRTKIVGGTIVAYRDGAHRILDDGVLVFEGSKIVHIGHSYDGPADLVLNARGKLVIPGFVSTHAHINVHEGTRLITDVGRRDVMRSGFLNYTPNNGPDGPPYVAAAIPQDTIRFGFAQLIRNGITTAMAFGGGTPGAAKTFAELAGESGMRVYYAPQANSAVNYFTDDGRMVEKWDEPKGHAELDAQEKFIEEHHNSHDGRFQGIVVIRNYALATIELMRRGKEIADRRKLRLTTHFCEQLFEFHRTVRDYGITPVDLMEREGLLGENVLLAHAIYLAGHSYTTWEYSNDLEKLGRTKTAVSHAPLVMLRRGHALEGFHRYLAHGVTMSMGTDVMPHDIIMEMRVGALACKLIARDHEVGRSIDFFNAATLGGAKALGRTDIGRLEVGAKADIVVMDFDNLQIGPVYDPIRSLVHLASPDLIEQVICDGRFLLKDGVLQNYDERDIVEGGKRSFQRVVDEFPKRHWSGKPVDVEYPVSLGRW
ncbi:amidohydrolase family protein [Bradyrhizobium sp. dw_78]|uniref:amidohydrolase family protein n=1 Tax=Bradyrhizobium sp. dw_78 TaxID=2719793 RepID=UPI001BD36B83|nr:amidohydrolase family protein [Bradyrhizobium sp. dw_78]